MSARQAAERLGVRPASLYAYVSRGLLSRELSADRRSRYSTEEIERLAERGRPRRQPEVADVPVHSELTAVAGGRCLLRGQDVIRLASEADFEAVSEWFWRGSSLRPTPVEQWPQSQTSRQVAKLAAGVKGALPLDRLRVAAAALAPSDPLRYELSSDAVISTGRRLIAGLVDCLPGPAAKGRVASRLWSRLGGRFSRRNSALLNQALILLLDHDLSLSTLAARVAASLEADPYAVVAVGLNALGGPLHSVAALAAEDLLGSMTSPSDAGRAVSALLRGGGRLPGFGHRLYPQGDPRAAALLRALHETDASPTRVRVIQSVIDLAESHGLPAPNIDFVLASIVYMHGLVRGASEAIFGIARSSGWIAHALEQYKRGIHLRPRLVYLGAPRPLER
jgi:citrate synthase